jgi:retron-type reverse transcriptase
VERQENTLRSQTVSLKLCQLSEQAKEHPDRVFTTLHHLIDVDFLREAYCRTNKKASEGVDEVTSAEYAANLEINLEELYRRYKEGSYIAPPVKRIWIEKEDKSQRPIVIPARRFVWRECTQWLNYFLLTSPELSFPGRPFPLHL